MKKREGKPESAIPKFEKAAALNPDDADAWYNWGAVLGMTGKLNEAVIKFKKAVEIKPDYTEAWNNWGIVLVRMGMPDSLPYTFCNDLRLKNKTVSHNNHVSANCSFYPTF